METKFHQHPNIDPYTNEKITIGDRRYNQLILLYGNPPKIKSPLTNRKININKCEYIKLIKQGYTDDQLLYDLNIITDKMEKLSIEQSKLFFGHRYMAVLKNNNLYIHNKQYNNVINCCCTMHTLFIYTTSGLYYINDNCIKIPFEFKISTMQYSFGYVFILTTDGHLYLYQIYDHILIDTFIKNIMMISTSVDHVLLLKSNGVYYVDKMSYLNINLSKYYKLTGVIKMTSSKCSDLILTSQGLYGIKNNELSLLEIDNVIDIASSEEHSMILNDKLYGFGNNKSGQLGQNNVSSYLYPCEIDIPKNTSHVYCSRHSTIIYNGQYYGFGDLENDMGLTKSLTPVLLDI